MQPCSDTGPVKVRVAAAISALAKSIRKLTITGTQAAAGTRKAADETRLRLRQRAWQGSIWPWPLRRCLTSAGSEKPLRVVWSACAGLCETLRSREPVAPFHFRDMQRVALVPLGLPALLRRSVLGVAPPLREGVGVAEVPDGDAQPARCLRVVHAQETGDVLDQVFHAGVGLEVPALLLGSHRSEDSQVVGGS
jgi:hypothetical protein